MSEDDNDCEWYETRTAIVGTRDVSFCAHAKNYGGMCSESRCPLTTDYNTEVITDDK